ncbi:MAG: glycosyltransferase [Deltaproteobacteria bacterium]|nr:glycosyltransferase [Deltaproteobacteria bacterium]
MEPTFEAKIQAQFKSFIEAQNRQFGTDSFRMDIHCHDRNSDVPDELMGRILRSRETWLDTDKLVEQLKAHGQDVFTITNHNNARSCYAMQDAGYDVMVGAEFTCNVPQTNDVAIHVLTYGFTPSQESRLNQLRVNLLHFLDYARAHNLPTVLAHPLFFYDPKKRSNVELIELFTLLFENFEVVNGQRDPRQALLMVHWLVSLTEEKIDALAKKHSIDITHFSDRPYQKGMTGGSDCHMGMFAGATGTTFHVPHLQRMLRTHTRSELALNALQKGHVAPFGTLAGGEKMTAAFLHFFCQLTMYLDDPGLVRMLLHKGSSKDKMLAFITLNAIMELRRHKYTSRFLRTLHDALNGKKPGFVIRRVTNKAYRPLLLELDKISEARLCSETQFVTQLEASIPAVFNHLTGILAARVENKMKQTDKNGRSLLAHLPSIQDIEVPAYLRTWFQSISQSAEEGGRQLDVASWSDGLPFPALAASCVLGAKFVSAKVQHTSRPFLNAFAKETGSECAPENVLWMSDTFNEKNGVANSLKLFHDAAKQYQLPFHFAISSHRNHSNDQLTEFAATLALEVPFYRDQSLRFTNILELEKTFMTHSCTRLLVSTEGPMGLCALYLKMAYNVPAYFYLHTDWLEYARQSLHFEPASIDRLRRMLRWFYSQFDGIFVLNSEHAKWLTGKDMEISKEKIHLTAHWCNPAFFPRPVDRSTVFPTNHTGPTLLYAGRLSKEKGVLDLPHVFHAVAQTHPDARMAIVGSGPEKETLERELPDAIFFEWVQKSVLANIYAASDIFLFPSTFDTFGNSVLESLTSGTPVIAYNRKGPKDIIENGDSGFLVNTKEEMIARTRLLLDDETLLQKMRLNARKRAADFKRENIILKMMQDMNMTPPNLKKSTSSLRSLRQKSA